MTRLMKLIRTLVPRIGKSAHPDAAYLDEAVDIPDLERRMREVDARSWDQPARLVTLRPL